MALNIVVCLAAIILNLCFVTEKACRRLGIRPAALMLGAAAALALSGLNLRPIGELCFDAAVFAAPLSFALLSAQGGSTAAHGKAVLAKLAAWCLLPVLVSAAFALAEFFIEGYAVVELRENVIIPWQFLLSTATLAAKDIMLAKKVTV